MRPYCLFLCDKLALLSLMVYFKDRGWYLVLGFFYLIETCCLIPVFSGNENRLSAWCLRPRPRRHLSERVEIAPSPLVRGCCSLHTFLRAGWFALPGGRHDWLSVHGECSCRYERSFCLIRLCSAHRHCTVCPEATFFAWSATAATPVHSLLPSRHVVRELSWTQDPNRVGAPEPRGPAPVDYCWDVAIFTKPTLSVELLCLYRGY